MPDKKQTYRPARLDNAPLEYEPVNELGVVFLFGTIAKKKYGLRVERIGASYPDCIAYQQGKKIRIEFELRSSNFARHNHDPKRCDWIVCWKHDWTSSPKNIRIVELRKEYGHGFDVWIVPVAGKYSEELSILKVKGDSWSVPSKSTEGDLLLFYRKRPEAFIRDIFRVNGPVRRCEAGWKPGLDWMAPIRRVTTLNTPLHLKELRSNPVIGTAAFLRGGLQGRPRVTAHWPELHEMITNRNPSTARVLRKLSPGAII